MAKLRVTPTAKICKGCGKTKPASEFHSAPANRDGLNAKCKPCRSIYMAGLYEREATRIKARMAQYYVDNRDAVLERVSNNYYRNPEQSAVRTKAWRAANWERLRPEFVAYAYTRDAHIKQATPPWADPEKILAFYREAAELTVSTGIKHNVDHIIPLRGKLVCGLHVQTNMRVITERANKTKHNKYIPELLDG